MLTITNMEKDKNYLLISTAEFKKPKTFNLNTMKFEKPNGEPYKNGIRIEEESYRVWLTNNNTVENYNFCELLRESYFMTKELNALKELKGLKILLSVCNQYNAEFTDFLHPMLSPTEVFKTISENQKAFKKFFSENHYLTSKESRVYSIFAFQSFVKYLDFLNHQKTSSVIKEKLSFRNWLYLERKVPAAIFYKPNCLCYIINTLYKFDYIYELESSINKKKSSWSLNMINDYIKICYEMDKPLQKTNSFMREYRETQKEYNIWKEKRDNLKIVEKYKLQNDECWNFHFDNYCVVLPQTKNDVIDEGRQQHNCVASYIDNITNKHLSYIVFIRKQDEQDKSYITCEITFQGYIIQYLKTFNQKVSTKKDLAFKEAFQKHLLENWQ